MEVIAFGSRATQAARATRERKKRKKVAPFYFLVFCFVFRFASVAHYLAPRSSSLSQKRLTH